MFEKIASVVHIIDKGIYHVSGIVGLAFFYIALVLVICAIIASIFTKNKESKDSNNVDMEE